MAKEKEEKIETSVDPRTEAWKVFLAKYEKDNPVKFAAKKARGEFDTIPASFKG